MRHVPADTANGGKNSDVADVIVAALTRQFGASAMDVAERQLAVAGADSKSQWSDIVSRLAR